METIPRVAPYSPGPKQPLWLWWNIACIDAPAVAAAWAVLFRRASGLTRAPLAVCVLALSVWLIYLADHFLDGRRGEETQPLQARHRYWAGHGWEFAVIFPAAAAGALWLTSADLARGMIRAGATLAAVVAIYLLAVHGAGRAGRRFPAKEVAVGLLFAAGTTLPVWSRPGGFSREALAGWTLFGCLCVLNCVAIECWENPARVEGGAFLRWVDRRIGAMAGSLAVVALVARWALQPARLAAGADAVTIAATLTWLLDAQRPRIPAAGLRVLADVVLLTGAVTVLLTRI